MFNQVIACIGDSIVAGEDDETGQGGWVGRLGGKVAPDIVYNLGICGDPITGVYSRLGEIWRREADVVVLGCGFNDIKVYTDELAPRGEEYAVPAYTTEKTWQLVLKTLKQTLPSLVVLPHDTLKPRSEGGGRIIRQESIEQHRDYITGLCDEFNVPVLKIEGLEARHTTDGLHLNALGYQLYADQVYAKLVELNYVEK